MLGRTRLHLLGQPQRLPAQSRGHAGGRRRNPRWDGTGPKIARDCPTALDPADDSNNSAADLSPASPQPRPNSVPPTEQLCPSSGGSSGGSGGSSTESGNGPQTILRRKPPKRTSDRTPTFRFGANETGVSFECKLDGKRFRACRSPFTAKTLSFGAHRFQVRVRDSEGKVDPTPASTRFRVVRHR